MRKICVLVCAVLALSAGDAFAQRGMRVWGPEGIAIDVGPMRAGETEASLRAQIVERLVNFDNTGVEARNGVVNPGDEIATRTVPYENVARLREDVVRSSAMGGSEMVLLRAGTPIYTTEYVNQQALQYHNSALLRWMYCGANGETGYCVLGIGNEWRAAEIRSESPYLPTGIGQFLPVNEPLLEVDPSAIGELPKRTEVYRLVRMRGSRATISRSMRIGDGQEIEAGEVRVEKLLLGSILVELERAENGGAMVRSAPLDPADYEDELDDIAKWAFRRWDN